MSVTDQEIFDQAVEQTENTPETPVEAPTEAKTERGRDERGRFAKATPDEPSQEAPVVPPQEEQPEAEKEEGRIPSWRLKEESDRRREAEQALNELRNEFRQMQMAMLQARQPQQPQEAPDIFADPQGFVQALQNNFETRLRSLQLENSLRFAHSNHGDKFNEAYNVFTDYVQRTRDQASYQRVMASTDPGEALVQWYKDQELRHQLGGSDLRSFIEKQKDEWLKDPQVQAKVIEAFKATQSQPSNPVHLPPSLSRAAAARSSHDEGGASGADMYSYATKR